MDTLDSQSTAWAQAAQEMWASLASWLPHAIGALLVLLLGWIVAVLARGIVRGVLRRIGLDRVAERSGVAETLESMNIDRSAAALVGRVVYWLVLLFFVLVALEGMGLTAVTETLGAFVAYLPRVIVAVLVVLVGFILARLVGDGLTAFARGNNVGGAGFLGQIARYILLVFTVVLALDQLRLDTSLITSVILVISGTLGLMLAISFGIGTRDLAGRVVAGIHAKETFDIGQTVRVGGHHGRIARIGSVTTMLETDEGRVSIPNDVLLSHEVTILEGTPSADAPEDPTA